MESNQFYILAGLSGISIAGTVIAFIILFNKLRTVLYLLEQPIVKKMSPQLKLKPVKIDDHDHSAPARPDNRPAQSANGNRGPRPNFERPEGGDRQNRDSQPRQDRGPRPEGNDRGPAQRPDGGDRGPRNDRFSGRDRGPRNDRNDRNDRHDRGGNNPGRESSAGRDSGERGGHDRNRNRSETFSNTHESVSGEAGAPLASRPAPVQAADHNSGPALAPRRPLPSTVDQEVSTKAFTPPEPISAGEAADALFMRDDSDIQHGRRNQLKKKPKFDVGEEDLKAAAAEETKV
jgi:hypothetical protein